MDPISAALLAALAGGVGGELGRQVWAGLGTLVRKPFQRDEDGGQLPATRPGEAELTRLEEQPDDPMRAQALSTALAMRAAEDSDFRTGLQQWLTQATALVHSGGGETRNEISGGAFHDPVLQGRDFSGASFTTHTQPSPQERAVRSAIDLSYERLDPLHARLFRLLPLNAGPDISTSAATHLAGIDRDEAEKLLQDLARAHLIEPGDTRGRWRLHDLVRLYADETGKVHAGADDREAARRRLYAHYIAMASAASYASLPWVIFQEPFSPPKAGDVRFSSRGQAAAWLDGEHTNLVAAVTAPQAEGRPGLRVALAWIMGPYLGARWHHDDLVTVTETVLAISHDPNRSTVPVARVLAYLGRELEHCEHEKHGLLACAFKAQARALTIFREHHDRTREAWALFNLSRTHHADRQLHRASEALAQAAAIFREVGDQDGVDAACSRRRRLYLSGQV
jgi:hypothetical protein